MKRISPLLERKSNAQNGRWDGENTFCSEGFNFINKNWHLIRFLFTKDCKMVFSVPIQTCWGVSNREKWWFSGGSSAPLLFSISLSSREGSPLLIFCIHLDWGENKVEKMEVEKLSMTKICTVESFLHPFLYPFSLHQEAPLGHLCEHTIFSDFIFFDGFGFLHFVRLKEFCRGLLFTSWSNLLSR